MICSNCQSENLDTNKFCATCGTALQPTDPVIPDEQQATASTDTTLVSEALEQTTSNLETTEAAVTEEPTEPTVDTPEADSEKTQQEDAQQVSEATATPDEALNEQKEQVEKVTGGPFYRWATIVAGVLVLVFGGVSSFFAFWESEDNPREVAVVEVMHEQNTTAIEAIYMQQDEKVIYPNRMERIEYYVYPEQANHSNLIWESKNPAIKVNPSGYVTSNAENTSGDIILRTADGEIQARTTVNVGTRDDAFYATLDYIYNQVEDGLAILDYEKEQFNPGPVHDSAALETGPIQLFSTVEGNIEQYQISQKQFINKATDNVVDVDIYTHPTSNEIHKIVAIEYTENDELKITDFYYDNGSPFFYFERNENYYRPIAARQDFEGVRAYLQNDALIRYREIVKTTNGFEKTDYTFDDEQIAWKVYEYQNIDKDDVNKEKASYKKAGDNPAVTADRAAQYLQDEQAIVNAANNIYRAVIEQPDIMKVSGYVAFPDNSSAQQVPVKIFSEKYKLLVGETVTDAMGYYELNVPMNQGDYTILASLQPYRTVNIYQIDSNQGIVNAMQETMYLFSPNNQGYVVFVNLIDALSGNAMINRFYENYQYDVEDSYNENEEDADAEYYEPVVAQIYVRNGINNKTGTVISSMEIDLRYLPEIELFLEGGNYTVEVVINGYERNYFTLSTLQDGQRVQSNIVPKIQGNQARIVLNWSHAPSDLDSHLFFPNGSHIAYYEREYKNSFLDVDDMDGYGPETITINDFTNGTYKYYVADFTNLAHNNYHSYEMSNSFARVDVYTKEGLTSFNIPRNQSSVIWQVFNISNGTIIPIQRLYNNVEDYDWWTSAK